VGEAFPKVEEPKSVGDDGVSSDEADGVEPLDR